jgi:hypothetical protein
MNNSHESRERKTRFVFRVLAGVIAAFLLLVGLPAAILEGLDGAWLAWFAALSCLFAGIGLAGGARTGQWMFSRRIHGTGD